MTTAVVRLEPGEVVDAKPQSRNGRHSLRRRLPALIFALLGVLGAAYAWMAYREVKGALRAFGSERITTAASQVADLLGQSATARVGEAKRLALGADVVQAAAAAAAGTAGQSSSTLDAFVSRNPQASVWLYADNRPAIPLAQGADARTGHTLPNADRPDSPGVSPLRAEGGRIWYQVTVPIAAPTGETSSAGSLSILRPLTPSQAASLIERLIGSGAVLKFGNATGDVWTDLSAATAAPPRVSPGAAARYTRATGEAWIGVAVPVQGTPWLVWVEVAEQAMLAPARTLLRQMLPITLGLMVLGALAVYAVSSRITAPIESLVEAAEAIAGGDYSRRLGLARQDEIGRLAAAFDVMAAGIAGAHESLERRVAERTQQLENANRELEAFSYSVSHDLRAPLRHIDGFAQALTEDHTHGLDKDALHYLSRIRAGAQRMGTLIDDLLSLSRVTRAELNRTEFDLSGMVREIAARLQEEHPERRVAWTIAPGVRVRADAHLVRVALENLLGNAWKFTARREHAEIEFSAIRSAAGRLTFSVRDNGAGFDMAYAGKLFGAFQRLHGVTEFPGTGIGLATVQRIINRHGGRIQASAEVEKGATFTFTLGEQ